MKRKLCLFPFLLFGIFLYQMAFSQAPPSFPYQSILRDSIGNLLANQNVSFRFSILSGSSTGALVYQETHSEITSNLGLFNVNIGQGIVTYGTFISINWGAGSKYLMIELDALGGNNFVQMDTTQLLSVPYALYATNTSASTTHYIGENYGGGIVFFVYDNGLHGLIAANTENVYGSWANVNFVGGGTGGYQIYSNGIGGGMKNTVTAWSKILSASLIGSPIGTPYYNVLNGPANNIFKYAMSYSSNWNGVTIADWYIPSMYELNLMYLQKYSLGIFSNFYMSSNFNSNADIRGIDFSNGAEPVAYFYGSNPTLRLIRAF